MNPNPTGNLEGELIQREEVLVHDAEGQMLERLKGRGGSVASRIGKAIEHRLGKARRSEVGAVVKLVDVELAMSFDRVSLLKEAGGGIGGVGDDLVEEGIPERSERAYIANVVLRVGREFTTVWISARHGLCYAVVGIAILKAEHEVNARAASRP